MKIGQVVPATILSLSVFAAGCDSPLLNPTPTTSASVIPQKEEQVEVGVGVEQVILFEGTGNNARLQEEVNAWLRQNGRKVGIVRVLQSQSGSYQTTVLTISIFYMKGE